MTKKTSLKSRIAMAALAMAVVWGPFKIANIVINRNNNKLAKARLETGITHQYLDTDRNGKYDLYRFIQKGPIETKWIDWNGDGNYDSSTTIDHSRVISSPMLKEHTKEECQEMYRTGKIEFCGW